MTNLSKSTTPALQGHFVIILLPFILGIYLADHRNLTDNRVYFFGFLSAFALLLSFRLVTRQFGILLCALVLGFWCMFFSQEKLRFQKSLHFEKAIYGLFELQQVEKKMQLQKLMGSFSFAQNGFKRTIPLMVHLRSDSSKAELQPGIYRLFCRPEKIANDTYPGAFDQERYYELQQLTHRCFIEANAIHRSNLKTKNGWRTHLATMRNRLCTTFNQTLSPKAAAIANALIIGDRTGIDQELRSYFQATGAMHILAVSGMHIGLLILALLQLLGLVSKWINRQQALVFVLILVWYYAILTGLSASVLRSVFMYSVLLFSQLSGKQLSNLNALFFSAFCLLLYSPNYLFDLGFQLSYMAMIGIYLYYDVIRAQLHIQWKWLRQLWEGTALGLAATLTTLPLSLFHFHMYPNYAQLANLCLMSLSSFILIIGMFFPLLQLLPYLDHLSTFLLENSIQVMLWIMQQFSVAPGAISKGFVVPFWWVSAFWLLSFYWFYPIFNLNKRILQVCFVCLLFWMNHFKRNTLRERAIFYIQKEELLVLRNGASSLAIGTKKPEKQKFTLEALSNYYNTQIRYKQLKKGRYRFKFKEASIQMDCSKQYQLIVKAKKQTQNMEVF